jgi:hypothetical protein
MRHVVADSVPVDYAGGSAMPLSSCFELVLRSRMLFDKQQNICYILNGPVYGV